MPSTGRPSFSAERKTRQHVPLSAATSLPASIIRSTTSGQQPWRTSSVDCVQARTPPSPGRRQDDDRGGRAVSPRYKTELCRAFAEHGSCRYGDKCQFAHGLDDLRAVVRHPKYKTDLCRTYHTTGLCPYGPRCHFIHNDDDDARRRRQAATAAEKRHVRLETRESELRRALASFYQRQAASTSSKFHLEANSDQSATAVVADPRLHVALHRRQSVPSATVFQSSTLPSSMISVSSPSSSVAGAFDSVGNSPSSSTVDDDSPPPSGLSPAVHGAADVCRQLLSLAPSNDHMTELLILASRLRLLRANSASTL